MNKVLDYLKGLLRQAHTYEPAALAWAVNGGLAAFLAYVLHLSTVQEAAVTTITTALVAIYTATQTRPVAISVITGAATTVAVAVGAFGLNLPSADIAAGVTILSAVLGLVLRNNVTPKANLVPAPAPVQPAAK